MARPKKAYRLWKRGKRYYYKLPGMADWRSTGFERKTDAENFLVEQLKGAATDAKGS